jgi:glycosyltransferase involved in cell wall biosynthesis
MKVLIYVVCYNAREHIHNVLKRIPLRYRDNRDVALLVSDDCSSDNTAEIASQSCKELGYTNYEVFRTKVNQGYGGNQKIGYNYACSNNFDYVILLHGDGQYAPEELDNFFKLFDDQPDVILGSRMLVKKDALKGKMPVIRFISNIILTRIQNFLAQTDFAEFHTGYRAYSTKFLKEVPFELNSNDFDFDTDILLQAKFLGKKIKEFPISTFYGQEKSRVKLIKYGIDILKTTLRFKLQQMGIGCSLKFRGSKQSVYKDKFGYKYTSHYYLLETIKIFKPKRILEISSGAGYLGEKLKDDNIWLAGIDLFCPQNEYYNQFFCENIEQFDWNKLDGDHFDMVCLMDILEHLKEPESILLELRRNPKFENAVFVISVPNVAFFSIRIGLLFGSFNYADRGILDISHKRLFTHSSFSTMLKECGFKISKTIPIPPPFKLLSQGFISSILAIIFNLLNKVLPGLFAFQIIKIAVPIPVSTNIINKHLEKYS